ncbi:hypothetical protein MF406_00010 [Georgenia sp. TF02-10]|uniref:hypothetical protein n=1 Tax=Georgenia sp. TF02-10 TaxID=2917725 RepID=UPI001FA6C7ED|nr:hypothetical protein [Georgenia sp. TF02-10]UNX54736.1 hypothetical protein MF406_00010 [Georgenia sp. TF02-10]
MSTMLQKAVTPQMSAAYLERGLDRVSGYVVPAAEAAAVTTTEGLFELHGLGFDGTPFAPDKPIDVLHQATSPTAVVVPAVGGTDEAGRRATGGPFLERPPFAGTGFATSGEVSVPLFWLEHTRLTPGARLWRFTPGAAEPELIGTYHGVVFGWQNHLAGDTFKVIPASKFVGPVAKLADGTFAADVRTDDDGVPTVVTIVAHGAGAEEHGFTQTKAGTWAKQLPASQVPELFEIHAGARWHGIPVRVVDQWPGQDGEQFCRVSSLAHDADIAERLHMDKLDAGVYESTVPLKALTDVVYAQRIPKAWAKEGQLSKIAEQQQRAAAAQTAAPAGAPAGAPAAGAPAPGAPAGAPAAAAPTPGAPAGPGGSGAPVVRVAPAGEAGADHPLNRFAPELQRVAQGLVRVAPTGWTRARVLCRMTGSRGEILAGATRPDGSEVALPALPGDVGKALAEMRHKGYEPGKGAWFGALVTLESSGRLSVRLDHEHEQQWAKPLEPGQYTEDLRRYPRDPEHIPDWLRQALDREAASQPSAGPTAAQPDGTAGGAQPDGTAGASESSTDSAQQPDGTQRSQQPGDPA